MRYLTIALFLLLSAFRPGLTQSVSLSVTDHVIDLTRFDWRFVALAPNPASTLKEVDARTDWRPIRVGKRWEFLGHPELKDQTVWVKFTFRVPAALKAYRVGFFATMIDDEGAVYLNGRPAGRFKYLTGGKVPHPVDIDLTPYLDYDGENTLLVEIRDAVTQRMGGIIGSACLYKTLPNTLTADGGIGLAAPADEPLGVLLHQGDARLVQGERQTFTAGQLAGLRTPPSILRGDELIIVAPARHLPATRLRVDLDAVQPTSADDSLTLTSQPLPATVGLYELLRIPVEVRGTFRNPFDPKQISVTAVIETPSGRIEKVNAFFGQDFEPVGLNAEEEILLPLKGNPWKLYYRPRQKGRHKVELFAQDRHGLKRIEAGSFEAVSSEARGYLRKSAVDPRLYEFDNGEPYFGRGPSGWFRGSRFLFGGNIRWVPYKLLDEYYDRKQANGSNFEYLATFHFGTLYLKDGFIDQHVAWKMEQALRSMERHGLYWIVFHDGVLRSYQNGFETLPYSTAQGGPCRTINEVYTHPVALEMQKNELRYMVSRMADSPSLWLWNCGDESQPGTRLSKVMVRDWLKELHGFIRQTDIYEHSHSIGEYELAVLNGGDVVLLGDWYYHNDNRGDEYDQLCNGEKSRDAVAYNLCLQEKFRDWKIPVVNIEGGICQWENFSWLSGEKYKKFPEAIDFHQHLWLSLFTKMAAGGTEWLNQALDEMNELYHAKAVENYLRGEPLTRVFHEPVAPAVSDPGLQAFGLQTDRKTLVWVNNRFYSWYHIGVEKKAPVPVRNARLALSVKQPGTYRVEVWDTRKGVVVGTSSLNAENRTLTIPLPEVDKDVALKIARLQPPAR
ncbi:hypothetical protein [Larkinella soli]|uniref:hypothetical protein n=1 Tax=Larkinella soli TaxID=1770527 RepID=UPI000FFCBC14|nr:hypothetical protein [Larkinella soli]